MVLSSVAIASSGAEVYEEAYAKQIGFLLDNAKPGMQIKIDFTKGLKVAEKNFERKLTETEKENLVWIGDGEVIIKLLDKGGYKFRYFSDYEVSEYFHENLLIINVY